MKVYSRSAQIVTSLRDFFTGDVGLYCNNQSRSPIKGGWNTDVTTQGNES